MKTTQVFGSPDNHKKRRNARHMSGKMTPAGVAGKRDENVWIIAADADGPVQHNDQYLIWNSCEQLEIELPVPDLCLVVMNTKELAEAISVEWSSPSKWITSTLEFWGIKYKEYDDYRSIVPDGGGARDLVNTLLEELAAITSDALLVKQGCPLPFEGKAKEFGEKMMAAHGSEYRDEEFLYDVYRDVLKWLGYEEKMLKGGTTAKNAFLYYGYAKREAGHDGVYILKDNKIIAVVVEVKSLAAHLKQSLQDEYHPLPQVVAECVGAAQRNNVKLRESGKSAQNQTVYAIVWCGRKVGIGKMTVTTRLAGAMFRYQPPLDGTQLGEFEFWYPKIQASVRGADLCSPVWRTDALNALFNLCETITN